MGQSVSFENTSPEEFLDKWIDEVNTFPDTGIVELRAIGTGRFSNALNDIEERYKKEFIDLCMQLALSYYERKLDIPLNETTIYKTEYALLFYRIKRFFSEMIDLEKKMRELNNDTPPSDVYFGFISLVSSLIQIETKLLIYPVYYTNSISEIHQLLLNRAREFWRTFGRVIFRNRLEFRGENSFEECLVHVVIEDDTNPRFIDRRFFIYQNKIVIEPFLKTHLCLRCKKLI